MNRHRLMSTTIAAFAICSLAAVPAFAGQRRGGGRDGGGGGQSQGRAVPRDQGPRSNGPQAGGRNVAPQTVAPRAGTPQRNFGGGGSFNNNGFNRSFNNNGFNRSFNNGFNRSYAAPRVIAPRGGYYGSRYVGPRSYGYGYRPYYYSRPYYTFRPRLSLGFGLWIGDPVIYPYFSSYYYPYGYSYAVPYAAPYAAPGYPSTAPYPGNPYPGNPVPPTAYPPANVPGTIAPSSSTGGLSFNITPGEAQIFVDGEYVGTADQFTPNDQPLGLSSGRHHVEIREPGFQTMTFDVDIIAGQVIPYQGSMQRL